MMAGRTSSDSPAYQEMRMNPFLNDTIARPAPYADFSIGRLVPPDGSEAKTAGRPKVPRAVPVRHRFMAGKARRLAAAGGLALALASSAHALDVNSASAEQLESLRGVGPKTARIIVQERQRGGRFESIEDFSDRVRGIGPKRARALQAAGLTVSGGPMPLASDVAAGARRLVPPRPSGRP
jgi:competence protein ComEA